MSAKVMTDSLHLQIGLVRQRVDQKKKIEEFYMLRPVNKTDHIQQGMNVLAQYHNLVGKPPTGTMVHRWISHLLPEVP